MDFEKALDYQKHIHDITEIINTAICSYKILEYIVVKASDLERKVITENKFLMFTYNVCSRTAVIELCKLYPESKNRTRHYDYSLPAFVDKVKTDFDVKIKIRSKTKTSWHRQIQQFYEADQITKKELIKCLYLQRNKWIAHLDKTRFTDRDKSGISLINLNQLIVTACNLMTEINEIIFGTILNFRTADKPTNDFIKTVNLLVEKNLTLRP
jgi:hypothetical protein